MTIRIQHGVLYLAELSPRQGTEPGKIRPVLVVQTDLLNEADHPSTWILPCTTRMVGENLLRSPLSRGIAGNDRDCEVMIDQSRSIDNRRFVKRLGAIPQIIMQEIKEKLRLLAEL